MEPIIFSPTSLPREFSKTVTNYSLAITRTSLRDTTNLASYYTRLARFPKVQEQLKVYMQQNRPKSRLVERECLGRTVNECTLPSGVQKLQEKAKVEDQPLVLAESGTGWFAYLKLPTLVMTDQTSLDDFDEYYLQNLDGIQLCPHDTVTELVPYKIELREPNIPNLLESGWVKVSISCCQGCIHRRKGRYGRAKTEIEFNPTPLNQLRFLKRLRYLHGYIQRGAIFKSDELARFMTIHPWFEDFKLPPLGRKPNRLKKKVTFGQCTTFTVDLAEIPKDPAVSKTVGPIDFRSEKEKAMSPFRYFFHRIGTRVSEEFNTLSDVATGIVMDFDGIGIEGW